MLKIPNCSALNLDAIQIFLVQISQIDIEQQPNLSPLLKEHIRGLAIYAEKPEEFNEPIQLIYNFFLHVTDFFVQTNASMLYDSFNDLANTPLFQVLIVLKRNQLLDVNMLASLLGFSNELNKLPDIFELLCNYRLLSVDIVRNIIDILDREKNNNFDYSIFLFISLNTLAQCNFLNAGNLQVALRNNLQSYCMFIFYLKSADLLLPYFGQKYLDRFAPPHALNLITNILWMLSYLCHDFMADIEKKMFFIVNTEELDLFFEIINKLYNAKLISSPSLDFLLKCKDLKRLDRLFEALNLYNPSTAAIHFPVRYLSTHVLFLLNWFHKVIEFDRNQTILIEKNLHKYAVSKIDIDVLLNHAIILISLLEKKGHLASPWNIIKLMNFLEEELLPSQAEYHTNEYGMRTLCQNFSFPFEISSLSVIFNGVAEYEKFTALFDNEPFEKSKLDALRLMSSLKLPVSYYLRVLAKRDPSISAQVLEILVLNNCLTLEFETQWLDPVLSHQNPISLANAIVALSRKPIEIVSEKLTKQLIDIEHLIRATQPYVFFEMLTLLFNKKMLKTEHLKLADQSKRCSAIVTLLNGLSSPYDCGRALDLLINQETIYQDPVSLAQGLVMLSKWGLLTDSFRQNDWNKFCQHLNPLSLVDTLVSLRTLSCTSRERDLYHNLAYRANPCIVFLSFNPFNSRYQNKFALLVNGYPILAMYKSTIYFIDGQGKITIVPRKSRYQFDIIQRWFLDLDSMDTLFPLSFEKIAFMRQTDTNFSFLLKDSENIDVYDPSFLPLFPCSFVDRVSKSLDSVKSLFHEVDSYYLNGIFRHSNPPQAAESVVLLLKSDMKEREFFDKLFKHQNTLGLAKGYLLLKNEKDLPEPVYERMLHYLFSSADPDLCVKAMLKLHAADLFTLLSDLTYTTSKNNFNLLDYFLERSPWYFSEIVVFFHNIDKLFMKHPTLRIRTEVLNFCKRKNRYHLAFLQKTLETFKDINLYQIKAIYRLWGLSDKKIDTLIEALQLLKKDTYCAKYFDCLFEFMLSRSEWATPMNLAIIVKQLVSVDCLGMDIKQIFLLFENLSKVQDFVNVESKIVEFFHILKEEKQLTKENVSRLFENNTVPCHFISIYHHLNQSYAKVFFKKFLPVILSYNDINKLDKVLQMLCNKPFFNEQHLNKLLAIDDLPCNFLEKMDMHTLLNEDTFNIYLDHVGILKHTEIMDLLPRIPDRSWTPKVLITIFTACQQPNNPVQAVIDCIRYTVIGEVHPTQAGTLLNERQSTHTASVHCTVSESARRLWVRYSETFSLVKDTPKIIAQIANLLFALPAGYRYDIAKKSWARMITGTFCEFVDPASQLSLYQLIALFWLALHDEQFQQIPCSKLDSEKKELPLAMCLLVDALCELQRDGNINAHGQDDCLPEDRLPSCASGSFNKFIEKLVGLHPDVQLVVMTKAGAAIKLKHLVEIKAFEHMKEQILAVSHQNTPCSSVLDDNLIESIWSQIKIAVAEDLFSEYGALYPGGIESEEFLALVACGLDHSLSAEKLAQLIQIEEQVRAGRKHVHDEVNIDDIDDVDGAPNAKRVYRSFSQAGFFLAPSTPHEGRASTTETTPPDVPQSPRPSVSD